jgi:hypothetical protein
MLPPRRAMTQTPAANDLDALRQLDEDYIQSVEQGTSAISGDSRGRLQRVTWRRHGREQGVVPRGHGSASHDQEPACRQR